MGCIYKIGFEVRAGVSGWIRVQWWAFVNTVKNLFVAVKGW